MCAHKIPSPVSSHGSLYRNLFISKLTQRAVNAGSDAVKALADVARTARRTARIMVKRSCVIATV
jgi:hypothetical protein